MPHKRRVLVIAAALVVVVAMGIAVVRWIGGGPDSRWAAAAALAPSGSHRLAWTDWAGVRRELDADLSAKSTGRQVARFLDRGFESDLTSTSALVTSAPTLQQKYGVSPATLEWELLAQGGKGQVILMGLPESLDLDTLRATLEKLGYVAPDTKSGTWIGSPELLLDIGSLTQEMAYLRIDEEHRVLAASDVQDYLGTWQKTQRGDDRGDGIADALAAYDDEDAPLAGVAFSGDYVCGELAMSKADDADQTEAAELIADAGEVHPLRGYGMAALAGGSVRVAMAFESEDAARTDADSRSALAAGPAPGQGGTFPDRFDLGKVVADERLVTMNLAPVDGSFVLSDLSDGPVLFATC